MEILIVTGTYAPSVNGIAISVKRQKDELAKRGHLVTVVAPEHPKQIEEENVIRLLSVSSSKYPDYPILLPLPKIADFKNLVNHYQLVYFHHPFYVGDISLFLAKLNNCPSVFFWHTQYEHYGRIYSPKFIPKPFVSRLVRNSLKKIAKKTDHIIVETETMRKAIKNQGITAPVTVIPTIGKSMLLKDYSKEVLKFKYGFNPEKIVLLCVSRLAREKNIRVLFLMASGLRMRQSLEFCIVGGGPEQERLQALAKKLGIGDICRFLGPIDYALLPEIYSLADIFVYPSLTDTQALVITEAMSAGLPIIAFNAPGPKDFVIHNKTGLLARTRKEFTGFMEDFSQNPVLIKEMGENGFKDWQKLSQENSIEKTEKLFEKIIAKYSQNKSR